MHNMLSLKYYWMFSYKVNICFYKKNWNINGTMHSHINLKISYFLSSLGSYYFNHCIAFQWSVNNINSCIMPIDRHSFPEDNNSNHCRMRLRMSRVVLGITIRHRREGTIHSYGTKLSVSSRKLKLPRTSRCLISSEEQGFCSAAENPILCLHQSQMRLNATAEPPILPTCIFAPCKSVTVGWVQRPAHVLLLPPP